MHELRQQSHTCVTAGLQKVGASDTPLRGAPEAHAASAVIPDSHVGQDVAPNACQGQSRALEEPEALHGAASSRDIEPLHCLQCETTRGNPPVDSAIGKAALALSTSHAQGQEEQTCMGLHTAPATQSVDASRCMPWVAEESFEAAENCVSLPALETDPCAAASSGLYHLSAQVAGLQVRPVCTLRGYSVHFVFICLNFLHWWLCRASHGWTTVAQA